MTEIPIACSLDSHETKTRDGEWRSLLEPVVVDRSLIPEGVRLVMKRSPGIKEEIERLIALEQSCCPWILWEFREESSSLFILDVAAQQDEGVRLLQEWFAPESKTRAG